MQRQNINIQSWSRSEDTRHAYNVKRSSAITIQAGVRGHGTIGALHDDKKAAFMIQACERMLVSVRRYQSMRR